MKKYICNECGVAFVEKRSLKSHMNSVHLNIKPFKCEHCQSAFVVDAELKRHVGRVHLKEKNHPCKLCNKSFFAKKDLKIHTDSVHIEAWTSCSIWTPYFTFLFSQVCNGGLVAVVSKSFEAQGRVL